MALTPDWKLAVRIGLPEKSLTTRGFHLRRDARDIGRGRLPGAPRLQGVRRAGGGDAWILQSRANELPQLSKSANAGDVVTGGNTNLAGGVMTRPTFRRGDDLPGVGADASVAASGVTAVRKRVTAGGSWNSGLSTDSLPQPDANADTVQTYPLDRILEGKTSYPENTPWLLLLRVPENESVGQDVLANFYFGGGASVTPQNAIGGQFCLTLRGSGTAILWELTERPGDNPSTDPPVKSWAERRRLALDSTDVSNFLAVRITPYGRDRIEVVGVQSSLFSSQGFLAFGLAATVASLGIMSGVYQKQGIPQTLFIDQPADTEHTHARSATGAGNIALDHRRKPRADVVIVRLKYVSSGRVVDGPFAIPKGTPSDTPLTLRLDVATPTNTLATGGIYDASTHEPLRTDTQGRFLTNDGQRHYYATVALSSTDGEQTPVLWGYNVDMEPGFTEQSGSPVAWPTVGLSMTGPDVEPDHETASFRLIDRYGGLSLLRLQDRIRSTLSVYSRTTGQVVSHLLEGELSQTHAVRRGRANHLPNWYEYDARMVGLWVRIKEQFFQSGLLDFARDPNAPADANNQQAVVPWTVTDALRRVLLEAGVPPDEIDVPANPMRLWNPQSSDDLTLQYGTDFAELVQRWANDYLRCALVRDPNAGPRGMWRLLPNPQPPYNVLARFYTKKQPVSGVFLRASPTQTNVYGAGTALTLDDTWDTHPVAPQLNSLVVRGIGQRDDGSVLLEQDGVNADSISNPASPDYVGHVIPFSHGPDPSLSTRTAVDWQWRIIMERAGHAQKWFHTTTALVLIRDPQDPHQNPNLLRPLRINDVITIDGFPAIVRSCNPLKKARSDRYLMQEIEGHFL